MPLTIVNTRDGRLWRPDHAPLCPKDVTDLLAEAPDGPVILMIHGFKFSPFTANSDPHRHILSAQPEKSCFKAISWPKHLGILGAAKAAGHGIAFGWPARSSIWTAYQEAAVAGKALADLVMMIMAETDRPIHVVAHSLGARVFLSALHHLPGPAFTRVILLTGAEFRRPAIRALQTPAGKATEVVNVVSRENDLFELLLERAITPLNPLARSLGHGVQAWLPNVLDLQIDNPATQEGLYRMGFPIGQPNRRICHWSSYLRAGVFPLYRAFLTEPERLTLQGLKHHLPDRVSPRWSRLFSIPLPVWPKLRPPQRP